MKLAENILADLWYPKDQGDAFDASQNMAKTLEKINDLKPFPEVARKILAMLDDPNFEVPKVTNAIEEDPVLASNVLRVANSALFGGLNPSRTISQAIVRLGVLSLRQLVLSATIAGLFKDVFGLGLQIRNHCAATAALVRKLARRYGPEVAEDAFLCGLMHDLGKLLLMQTGDPAYLKIIKEQAAQDLEKIHLKERQAMGFDHAVMGGHVMVMWKIPEPVHRVVAWHHQHERALADPKTSRLSALVNLVDFIEPYMFHKKSLSPKELTQACEKELQILEMETEQILADWDDLAEIRLQSLDLFS
jgi:HD-like signal output (HDOD) protein